jgi:hypothetical protein
MISTLDLRSNHWDDRRSYASIIFNISNLCFSLRNSKLGQILRPKPRSQSGPSFIGQSDHIQNYLTDICIPEIENCCACVTSLMEESDWSMMRLKRGKPIQQSYGIIIFPYLQKLEYSLSYSLE